MTKTALKRDLGVWLLSFYGLGNILGAGIYVLVGKVAGEAGYLAPVSFLIAAIVAAFTAFTYAELSSRYPVAAGEAVYLQQGFGWQWLSVLGGMLIALSGMFSAATIARGFAGYVQIFFPVADAMLIIGILSLLGLIAVWGISESVKIAAFLTGLEIIGLLVIIVVGGNKLGDLSQISNELPSLADFAIWPGIFMGAFLAFYAFIGFEDMVNVAEEVREPEKNMPHAILIALIIATVLYGLVSLVAVLNMPPTELAKSEAPLADLFTHITGDKPVLITFISLSAVINGALIQIIMASRIFYGMANRGWLPGIFSSVNQRTQTPLIATVCVVAIVILLAVWIPLRELAESTSYLVLIIFILVNVALLRIRKRFALPDGVKGYPFWVPLCGAIASIGLFLAQITSALSR